MTGCTDAFAPAPGVAVTPITAAEAARFHGRAGVEFVDPRPAEAIADTTGIIPGARNISLGRISAGDLPGSFDDRSIHVITSCLAGPMAERAAAEFVRLGFARVSFVKGGTTAWIDAGLPTLR